MSHYASAARAKKPSYQRWWLWLVGIVGLIVVGLIVIIGSATGGSGGETEVSRITPDAEQPAEQPADAPEETSGRASVIPRAGPASARAERSR